MSKEAKLSFTVDKSFAKPKVGLELAILDSSTQENLIDKMSLGLSGGASSPPANTLQTPPVLQFTGIEGARSTPLNKFYVSGVASSDNPIKDVIIFVGDNKVFLKSAEGSDASKKLVFASQVPIEVKDKQTNNLITVLARDKRDLTSHKSFFIRKK